MITYRGHQITGKDDLFYIETNRPHLGKLMIGRFSSYEAAARYIDDMLVHPWQTDFRELARLIRGERLLPHGTEECSVCDEAFSLTLRARRTKMQETKSY